MTRNLDPKARRARAINRKLAELYPDARCALVHASPLQLLIATILSAQCTDAMVNRVTPALFARYSDAKAFAEADVAELETLIKSAGFFRTKTKSIRNCCRLLIDRFGGEVPGRMEDLLELPGVARKTANVVLGECFQTPGITVDTHVGRLSRRMGFTEHQDPVKVEKDVGLLLPSKDWTIFNHRMIFHGRQVCFSRKPQCGACTVAKLCPRIGVDP